MNTYLTTYLTIEDMDSRWFPYSLVLQGDWQGVTNSHYIKPAYNEFVRETNSLIKKFKLGEIGLREFGKEVIALRESLLMKYPNYFTKDGIGWFDKLSEENQKKYLGGRKKVYKDKQERKKLNKLVEEQKLIEKELEKEEKLISIFNWFYTFHTEPFLLSDIREVARRERYKLPTSYPSLMDIVKVGKEKGIIGRKEGKFYIKTPAAIGWMPVSD
jgi:hypothetical protein